MKVQVVRDTDCQYIKNGEELEVVIEGTNFSVRCKNGEVRSYDGSRLSPIAETVEVAKPTLPTLDALARAIFDTDERVYADVIKHAECGGWRVNQTARGTFVATAIDLAPYFDKAWSTNRNNWRAEAEARAASILSALKLGLK